VRQKIRSREAAVADKCFIPDSVCKHGNSTIKEDVHLANSTLTKLAWASLCAAPYNSHTDVVAVLQVLQVLADLKEPVLHNCSSRKLTTLWGLLAAEHNDAWYAGGNGAKQ
jgi:hypothetical protein